MARPAPAPVPRRALASGALGTRALVIGFLAVPLACGGADGPAAAAPDPDAPLFTTTPPPTADHNRPWSHAIGTSDPNGDPVTVAVERKPAWAAFDSAALTLSGTAGWENIGAHPFVLAATDGRHVVRQTFTVTVARGEILCDADCGDPAGSPYVLPFRVGATYRLIQGNCPPNPNWGHHNWFAYDFGLPNRDTVVASRGGLVRFTQSDRPNVGGVCGRNMENFVFIEHEDGTLIHYMHLFPAGVLVAPGDTVDQGQPIGLSGNSGCSAGPHLHVALFRDATNFDRQSTLPMNYANAAGPVDDRGGLVQGAAYTGRPFTPR